MQVCLLMEGISIYFLFIVSLLSVMLTLGVARRRVCDRICEFLVSFNERLAGREYLINISIYIPLFCSGFQIHIDIEVLL